MTAAMIPAWIALAEPSASLSFEKGFSTWPVQEVEAVDGVFTAKKAGGIYGKNSFAVDTDSDYVVSGEFRSLDSGKTVTKLLFGVIPIDSSQILPQFINVVPGTDTELAADCSAGDSLLKIKNGNTWAAYRKPDIATVAFDIDDSEKLRDLPNRRVTPPGIVSILKKNDIWEVTLKKACGFNYPSGTPVRLHAYGWSAIYAVLRTEPIPAEWTKVSAVIRGKAKPVAQTNAWWSGTRKCSFTISFQGGGIQFRNLHLEKKIK